MYILYLEGEPLPLVIKFQFIIMQIILFMDKQTEGKIKWRKNTNFNDTRTLIKKLKTEAPVLSTIVDYGGHQSVRELISINDEKEDLNPFAKLMSEPHDEEGVKKKHPSFLRYMSSPRKQKQLDLSPKSNKKKSLKSSIVVEMPKELKELKKEMLALPTIVQSRKQMNVSLKVSQFQNESSLSSSQLGLSTSKKKYRAKTEETFGVKDGKYLNKQYYRGELNKLLSKLDERNEVDENILINEKQCRRIIKAERQIEQKYKRFEGYGNPPQKIIHLLEDVNKFERKVDGGLDEELKRQMKEMSTKKYDAILKYEEQKRKMIMNKYKEQARKDKIQEKSLVDDGAAYKEDTKRFKINSKGREVFTYKKK